MFEHIYPKDNDIKFTIKKFQDETDSAVTHDEIEPGDIIIATNIAGRGTDFKTSSQLEKNNSQHVCALAFVQVMNV
jgi:preprotein translocase subunit SecA